LVAYLSIQAFYPNRPLVMLVLGSTSFGVFVGASLWLQGDSAHLPSVFLLAGIIKVLVVSLSMRDIVRLQGQVRDHTIDDR
ncbi:MAG: hypothetical protein ACRC0L_09075, partial [Angustibacter sp.]